MVVCVMDEITEKENIIVNVPAELKAEVRAAIKKTEFRSITHLVETQLKDFVAQQKQLEAETATASA